MDFLATELWEEILSLCTPATTGRFLCTCRTASALSEDIWQRKCQQDGIKRFEDQPSWRVAYRDRSYSLHDLSNRKFFYGSHPTYVLSLLPAAVSDSEEFCLEGLSHARITAWPSWRAIARFSLIGATEMVLIDLSRWSGCPLPRERFPMLLVPLNATDARIFPMCELKENEFRMQDLLALRDWLPEMDDCLEKVRQVLGDEASSWLQTCTAQSVTFFVRQ
eukprot:TRINITY_DN15202_c0_g1_i1.p1 TRINITY_DN15202_c0_g1~~TRINITY_DN15202_c0_g1_i1.p1  ORF type:complete len:221 (-),score=20.49 TRINITY_DN15202_c0_g1_i1:120-782(-)